ncbi:MAG: C39 family peptidase [Pseudomonadota bacterium]
MNSFGVGIRIVVLFGLAWAFFGPKAANADLLPKTCGVVLAAQMASEPMVSLSRPLPYLKQDCNGKCGPTSLAIALVHFGKLGGSMDPFAVSNQVTEIVYGVLKSTSPNPLAIDLDPIARSVGLNASTTLALTAQQFGLFARAEMASFSQLATHVANQEVVLVHWWQGPGPADYHWSVLQGIGPSVIHLRDPWPEDPYDNFQSLYDFQNRSSTGSPGLYNVVRISDRPIAF